jgi:hypothetical protein
MTSPAAVAVAAAGESTEPIHSTRASGSAGSTEGESNGHLGHERVGYALRPLAHRRRVQVVTLEARGRAVAKPARWIVDGDVRDDPLRVYPVEHRQLAHDPDLSVVVVVDQERHLSPGKQDEGAAPVEVSTRPLPLGVLPHRLCDDRRELDDRLGIAHARLESIHAG